MDDLTTNGVQKKNKNKVYIPMFALILIILILGWFWYREYSKYITTDDAYIDSDNVSISSKIMGRISYEYVNEGDSIKKGMLLAVLDSSDLSAQKNQAIALKNQAITSKLLTEASYQYDKESMKVLHVNYEKVKQDFERDKTQYNGGIITKEAYEHSAKALESTAAQLNAAATALNVSKAKIENAISAINSAESQIVLIETQLGNTKLYAPMDGIIAKRWLLPGDITSSGQSVFTISNNEKYWVIVYLEETYISEIHTGQEALIKIDAFSGIHFKGKIFSIGSNTASQFSLIPPNNASGNFTKVTQRVPLKISIIADDNEKTVATFKFLSGMSAEVKIIRD